MCIVKTSLPPGDILDLNVLTEGVGFSRLDEAHAFLMSHLPVVKWVNGLFSETSHADVTAESGLGCRKATQPYHAFT